MHDVDAYLAAHGYTRRQIQREQAWRIAGYVLIGMIAGYMVGSGLWLLSGTW